MPFTPKFVDLVRNVTTVQGTGPVTLGQPVNGYTSLTDAVSAGEQFYYCIQGVDKPQEREVGRGTMQADGKVAREPIAGSPTNFSNGSKTISLVAPAEWFAKADLLGGGALATVASCAELAGKDVSAVTRAYLADSRRAGSFLFDASDLSAKVAADSGQGIYVAPASAPTGASGAWARQINGPVDPRWFGIVEGAGNGAANSAALAGMFAALRSRAVNAATNYQGQDAVRFPPGLFEFAATIELTEGSYILEGSDTGYPSGRGTVLKFPAGVTGIRVQRYNTSGLVTDGTTHRGGDGAIIRNLALRGAFTTAEAEAHGIHLRARAQIENVYIEEFEGDGIYCNVTAGAGGEIEGNANSARIIGGRIQRCRRGIYINGADANIWSIIGLDCSNNRQWGFEDSSFLGNSYFGCHAAANGIVTGTIPTVVSHNGNRYGVIAGQEAGASTNAPSGTTADNGWWHYLSAGGVNAGSNINAWTSGTTYRAGGSYRTDDANARNVFSGCYHESGQGKAQLVQPTLVVGGMLTGSVLGTAAVIQAGDAGVRVNSLYSEAIKASGTVKARLGEDATATDTVLLASHSIAAVNSWRLKFSGNELRFDYANGGSAIAYRITCNTTTEQFGTGAAVPYAFYAPNLVVGDTMANARRMSNGTAAPTSGAHGVGEIVWNRTPASGQPMGWVCSAAGTPGSWLPLANIP